MITEKLRKKIHAAVVRYTIDKIGADPHWNMSLIDYVWDDLSADEIFNEICEDDKMTDLVNDETCNQADMLVNILKGML